MKLTTAFSVHIELHIQMGLAPSQPKKLSWFGIRGLKITRRPNLMILIIWGDIFAQKDRRCPSISHKITIWWIGTSACSQYVLAFMLFPCVHGSWESSINSTRSSVFDHKPVHAISVPETLSASNGRCQPLKLNMRQHHCLKNNYNDLSNLYQ